MSKMMRSEERSAVAWTDKKSSAGFLDPEATKRKNSYSEQQE